MEQKYIDGRADLTLPMSKKYRIMISQYVGNTTTLIRDEMLVDVVNDNNYDDSEYIGELRANIFENYDYLCKVINKWWTETDNFDLDDELYIEIYEIKTDDYGDDMYDLVDDYCVYENNKWNTDRDVVFDFEKMYDNLNLYQKNTLLAISFYGGYDLVDEFGLIPNLYFGDYRYEIGLFWDDLMNIQDIKSAMDFYDKFIYYDKENWFLNNDYLCGNSVDMEYELEKDYREIVNDCSNELMLSCKENREFNSNDNIKSQFDLE